MICLYDRYNRLFRFLLAVKRAQIDIQQCWTLQMQYKQKPSNQEEVAKWQLRTHMAFLVDNLQYYLQVWIFLVFIIQCSSWNFLEFFFSPKKSKMKLERESVIFVSSSFTFVIYFYALLQISQHIVLQKKGGGGEYCTLKVCCSTNASMYSYFLGSCHTLS